MIELTSVSLYKFLIDDSDDPVSVLRDATNASSGILGLTSDEVDALIDELSTIKNENGIYQLASKKIRIQLVLSQGGYVCVYIMAPDTFNSWKEQKNKKFLIDVESKLKSSVKSGHFDLLEYDKEVYGGIGHTYYWLKYFGKQLTNGVTNEKVKSEIKFLNKVNMNTYVNTKTSFFGKKKFLKNTDKYLMQGP